MATSFKDIPGLDALDKDLEIQMPEEITKQVNAYGENRSTSGTAQTEDELLRLREEREPSLKKYRWEKQEELARFREGRKLHCIKFLSMLNGILPSRFSGVSRHGLLSLECFIPTPTGGEWQFQTGVQHGTIPEFTTMYFDDHNLPTSEMYRGWRQTLITLIGKGTITEAQANKVFGEASGPESWRYRQQLWGLRNPGGIL